MSTAKICSGSLQISTVDMQCSPTYWRKEESAYGRLSRGSNYNTICCVVENVTMWHQSRLVRSSVLLLLYTLFIVEIKTGKMLNKIGPTVNKILKDIVEK